MKLYFLIIAFILSWIPLSAQDQSESLPVNVGLYAPYFIQPGIKVGTTFDLQESQKDRSGSIRSRTLYISPQIGMFVRPKNNTNLILNADLGYRFGSDKRRLYLAPSLGFGYWISRQLISERVDLSGGLTTAKDHEIRGNILPTVNGEIGKRNSEGLGWFVKLSYGRKMAVGLENAGFFGMELGLSFNLKKK